MKGRTGVLGVIAIVVVVMVGVLLVFGSSTHRPFDLDSTAPTGYKGLRLTLEGLGASVEPIDIDDLDRAAADRFTSLLVMGGGGATPEQVSTLRALAAPGRTVVTAGPVDGLGPHVVDLDEDGFPITAASGDDVCDIEDLRVVGPLGGDAFQQLVVPSGADSCIGDGTLATVVSVDVEAGRIVTVASPWLFTNDAMRPHDQEVDDPQLPMPDNVVLAGRLLVHDDEGTPDRIGVVTGLGGPLGGGDTTLGDLLSPGVKLGLWQLVIAFAVYAWWRGRRLGRPVEESLPVTISGSELVAATGNFRERQGDAAAAATVLRRNVVRQLATRLGLPLDSRVELIAAQAAAHAGRDPGEVDGALWAWPVTTDADLVRVTTALDAIRQEVSHV